MKNSIINAITFLSAICLFSIASFSQSTSFFIGSTATGHLSSFDASGDFSEFQQSFNFTNGESWVTPSQTLETKSLAGLSGGLTFGVQLGKFSIVSGATFKQKGAKYESRIFEYYDVFTESQTDDSFIALADVGTFKATERQNFIQIPLLARYQFLGDGFGITLACGPAFNIGIGESTYTWEFKGVNGTNTPPKSDKDSFGKDLDNLYKPVQTSFIISPGVIFPINESGKLNITFFWDSNVSSSINETISGFVSGDKKNKGFGIGVSYEHHIDFRLGTKH